MSFILAAILLFAMSVCVLLNLVTLPGNWAALALTVVWAVFMPGNHLGILFFCMAVGLAVLGELVEFAAQIWGAKTYGSSKASTIAGIIGAIAGAIAGAPFMLGLGAVCGALFGAWAGCYLAERLIGRQPPELAFRAAQGAFVGKFLGMVIKFGIGVAIIAVTAAYVWPESAASLQTAVTPVTL